VAERRSSSAAAAVQMAREDEEFAVAVNGDDGGGCHGGWKERRKLGLGFWEMKMMTWQPSIGQLVSARIVATWLALVG